MTGMSANMEPGSRGRSGGRSEAQKAGHSGPTIGGNRPMGAKGWDRYPLTVTADRYGGSYSGGDWLAFKESPDEIPPDPWGCDVTAMNYWAGSLKDIAVREKGIYYERGGRWHPDCVGRGTTPEEAVADLDRRRPDTDTREWTQAAR